MTLTKLRVGMVGGGEESFMGRIHRQAIERSGCLELAAGAFGTTRQRSFETGKALKLNPRRTYGVYRDMFKREQTLPEGERIDFVSILAPNNMHYPVTMAAFDAGFPVFSEKPITNNIDEAINLKRKAIMTGAIHATAYAYPFYPAVIRMKKYIADGGIGAIRRVKATFSHGWMGVRLETAGHRGAGWRTDPRRAGAGGAIIDLCGHCAFLTEHLTGLKITEVCVDARPCVAGRMIDDDAAVLVRFDNGCGGTFFSSQIALGEAGGIEIAVYGDKGTALWRQSEPEKWQTCEIEGTPKIRATNGPAATQGKNRFREPYGDDEAYIEALTVAYRDFVSMVLSRRLKKRLANHCVSIDDAIRVVAFTEAAIRNNTPPPETVPEKWTPVAVPPVELLN